ncbi:putative ribonuclease H-like domain-containing protein [Tanacetum coccineum]
METSNDSFNSSKKNDDFQKEQDRIISNTDVSESSGSTNPTATSKDHTADQVEPVLSSTMETKVPTAPSLGNAMSFKNILEDVFGDTTALVSLNKVENDLSDMETDIQISPTPSLRLHKVHPKSQIIGLVDTPVQTRQKTKNMEEQSFIATIHQKTNPDLLQYCLFSCFLSQEKPKKILDALKDSSWVEAMQEELLLFKIQNVWVLVDCPKGVRPIGTKWVLKNKRDERGIPPRFQDSQFPDRVYKVVMAMYGLHQAPRAWYGTLSKYLLDNGFQRGTIDQTLFIRKHKGEFLLVQVYVDDIIFRSSNPKLCREFENLMHDKFKMSAMGELNFFLGLQVLQKKDGIFLSQDKRILGDNMETSKDTPSDTKRVTSSMRKEEYFKVPKRSPKVGYFGIPKESPFDLVAYSDSDYGGATQDRKSTTRGCQFLGRRLISWQCKKQTVVATSTTKAEYVAAASGCGQVLWIQN